MNRFARVPLLAVLAVALIVVGVLSGMSKNTNPSQLPSTLALGGSAESTALYCTGFTSAKLGESGRVILLNTTDQPHVIGIERVSNLGKTVGEQRTLPAHQQYAFDPSAGLAGDYFGVGAQVTGGGVVGVEVTKNQTSEAPCISTGVRNWFAAGFDTTVGSTAILSVYNPTATPAVFNVSTFSSSGYVAPQKFQGYAVAAHSQADLNLGTAIVDLSDIGVHVHVLRGTLDIIGLQQSGPVVSYDTGVAAPSTSALFPLITTANNAVAELRFSNPGSTPAIVTMKVTLAGYHVPDQTLTVPPYGSALTSITPNPAIPIAGYASVAFSSTKPVIAALATGTGKNISLSAAPMSQPAYVVGDFTGHGFDAATFTNTSSTSIAIRITTLPRGAGATSQQYQVHLAGSSSESVKDLVPALADLRSVVMIVTASQPSLVVALTVPTQPAGMTVVSGLDGR